MRKEPYGEWLEHQNDFFVPSSAASFERKGARQKMTPPALQGRFEPRRRGRKASAMLRVILLDTNFLLTPSYLDQNSAAVQSTRLWIRARYSSISVQSLSLLVPTKGAFFFLGTSSSKPNTSAVDEVAASSTATTGASFSSTRRRVCNSMFLKFVRINTCLPSPEEPQLPVHSGRQKRGQPGQLLGQGRTQP